MGWHNGIQARETVETDKEKGEKGKVNRQRANESGLSANIYIYTMRARGAQPRIDSSVSVSCLGFRWWKWKCNGKGKTRIQGKRGAASSLRCEQRKHLRALQLLVVLVVFLLFVRVHMWHSYRLDNICVRCGPWVTISRRAAGRARAAHGNGRLL